MNPKEIADIANNLQTNDLHKVASAFSVAAEAHPDAKEVLHLLQQVCWIMLVPGDSDGPYKPMSQGGDKRSLLPQDLTDDQLAQFVEILSHTTLPCLRARISDVCFQKKPSIKETREVVLGDFTSTIQAIKDRTFGDEQGQKRLYGTTSLKLIHRSLQIARRMKNNDCEHLCDFGRAALEQAIADKSVFGACRSARLCSSYDLMTEATIAAQLEPLLEDFDQPEHHHERVALFEAIILHNRSAQDDNNYRRVSFALAAEFECQSLLEDSAMVAAHRIDSAIKCLRQLPKDDQTVAEIARLRGLRADQQLLIPDQMVRFSHKIDISDDVKEIYQAFLKMGLQEAFLRLALLRTLPERTDLEGQAKELVRSGPLMSIMPMKTVDDRGQGVFADCGLSPSEGETEEGWQRLFEQSERLGRTYFVQAQLYPALQAIRERFAFGLDECQKISASSIFVCEGHEFSTAKGLHYFLQGDTISAANILIPQLEAYLRSLLQNLGMNVTNDIEQWQEGFAINKLLSTYQKQLAEVYGEETALQLQIVFNYKGGPNVRNRLAHGLADDGVMMGPDVTYASWLVVRLILLPLLGDEAGLLWRSLETSIE